MERSLRFYCDVLGFRDVVLDYAGPLSGMERVTGRPETSAHVVFLRNPHVSPLGRGLIKLVRVLPPESPGPIPPGTCWGEVGVAEVCLHVRGAEAVVRRLVEEQGCKVLLPLAVGPGLTPEEGEVAWAYIEDPDGGKVELIEWRNPQGLQPEPRIEGISHVAFGVADAERSLAFYRGLGFTDLVADFQGVLDPMSHWFPDPLGQEQRLILLNSRDGAGVEIVQQIHQTKDCRGTWGRLGPMEFAIEVSDIEAACSLLETRGTELLCSPQTVDTGAGAWRYAYFVEPDDTYVSLIETRF